MERLHANSLKGIVRPFELAGETRLIRSTVINWRPGKFFLKFKISREKHKTIKDFWDGFVQSKWLTGACHSPGKSIKKNTINYGLPQAGITRPRKMGTDWNENEHFGLVFAKTIVFMPNTGSINSGTGVLKGFMLTNHLCTAGCTLHHIWLGNDRGEPPQAGLYPPSLTVYLY